MYTVHLTNTQRGHLRKLLIEEAKELGYGTKYNEWNRDKWPTKLKNLSTLAKKLVKDLE